MLQSRSDIEAVPFADGCLAHNLATGALCRLNATAAQILTLVIDGKTHSEAAGQLSDSYGITPEKAATDVDAITRAWADSGLLRAADAADTMPRGLAEPEYPADLDITVSCGGPPVRVRCEEPELSGLLAEVMAPAETDRDRNDIPPDRSLSLAGREGDYQCWCGGTLRWRYSERPWARRFLLQEVIRQSLPAGRLSAILHASAVQMDGKAVILAGFSGAGKSTLTAGLVAAGGKLIADDLLPLGLAEEGVWPVPFAISAKQDSWPVLAPLFAGFERLKVLTSRGIKVRYLAPALADRGTPVRPALVLFPRWDPQHPAEAAPLSEAEIADGLIRTGTDLDRSGGAVAQFAAFSASVAGHRLTYPSLDEGIELVGGKLAALLA